MNFSLRTAAVASAMSGLLLAATPSLAGAATSMSSDSAMTSSQDATFAMKFMQSGTAEMTMARAALKTSSNASVKAFARKMIQDHTKAGDQLAAIAKPKGYAVPMTLDEPSKIMSKSLMEVKGAAFDSTYKQDNIIGHKKALALLQTEVASGKDPKLVAYAKMTIPTVQQHLQLAMNLPST